MRQIACYVLFVAALLAAGCGHRAAPLAPKAKPTAVAQKPLPDWAPKDPSPEFLRAARWLKPLPESTKAAEGIPAATIAKMEHVLYPAEYEFFGTLTDEQIARLRATKTIRIPVKSMPESQRAALDRWFEAWRQTMTHEPPESRDFLIMIYKVGAREDLSNVTAGFSIYGDHWLHIELRVKPPNAEETWINSNVAYID